MCTGDGLLVVTCLDVGNFAWVYRKATHPGIFFLDEILVSDLRCDKLNMDEVLKTKQKDARDVDGVVHHVKVGCDWG